MDYVAAKIDKFVNRFLSSDSRDSRFVLDNAQKELLLIDGDFDQIRFINAILEKNNWLLEKHKRKCTSITGKCPVEFAHTEINYQLQRDLKHLGVEQPESGFSSEEKIAADSRLDQILSELEEVKMRQHAAYDVILEEIEELKNLYFLGKKNWKQLLIGKITDMTVSGIISETLSKRIISGLDNTFSELIQ